jgi:hypothetical protein
VAIINVLIVAPASMTLLLQGEGSFAQSHLLQKFIKVEKKLEEAGEKARRAEEVSFEMKKKLQKAEVSKRAFAKHMPQSSLKFVQSTS